MRGKLFVIVHLFFPSGSIPACAGETWHRKLPEDFDRVYPRLCGGNAWLSKQQIDVPGLSPLVRGKRVGVGKFSERAGSIPACAGETSPPRDYSGEPMVYPRLCGGNGGPVDFQLFAGGLSPLVRGKQNSQADLRSSFGSIPACAGETLPRGRLRIRQWVYPRLCGGNTNLKQYETGN